MRQWYILLQYRKSREMKELILKLQTLKCTSTQNLGDIKFPTFEADSAARHRMETAWEFPERGRWNPRELSPAAQGRFQGNESPEHSTTGQEGWDGDRLTNMTVLLIHPAWSRPWCMGYLCSLSPCNFQGAGGRLWCSFRSSWACTGAPNATLLLGQGSFALQTGCKALCFE